MNVRIYTDSATDLPASVTQSLGITVMPLMVSIDGHEYEDGVTLTSKEMFDGMREGKDYKTAQVPIHIFQEVFQSAAEAGEEILYIAFSSGLSGTYSSAVMVLNMIKEDYPDIACDVIDTKCASVGFGLVVRQAALWAQEGLSRAELVDKVTKLAANMEHVFTVDDLEYLYRGGRVSKTSAVIGGLLNIKPVLDVEDGKLIPIEKVRGRKKSISRLAELFEERGITEDKDQLIGISHGDDPETAESLKAILIEKYGLKNFIINSIGCAIGAHAGPGTMSLFFLNKNYSE
ncbi:DegV family protein [Paenibacillus albiflavus]|uniref:DegV family protein n=1 Tax=Paenibacillus albiflavus TaxID=2545760 RepID=A0A4R4EJ53_9BACL|nr:DegV family protein [Paenibacillus albiflavus]TCZ78255.1 DegV family protein [Paenibacillus albiflavus]